MPAYVWHALGTVPLKLDNPTAQHNTESAAFLTTIWVIMPSVHQRKLLSWDILFYHFHSNIDEKNVKIEENIKAESIQVESVQFE